jgi:hydrogenase/urease accessory protein HupE
MTSTLALSEMQMWIVVVGILSPIVAYALNNKLLRRFWANLPEPIAGMIHLLVAAVAAGVYTAIETSQFGWNAVTEQYVLTAILASFLAHGGIWKPVGVQAFLTRVPTARWRWQRVPIMTQSGTFASPASKDPTP